MEDELMRDRNIIILWRSQRASTYHALQQKETRPRRRYPHMSHRREFVFTTVRYVEIRQSTVTAHPDRRRSQSRSLLAATTIAPIQLP